MNSLAATAALNFAHDDCAQRQGKLSFHSSRDQVNLILEVRRKESNLVRLQMLSNRFNYNGDSFLVDGRKMSSTQMSSTKV